MRRVVERARKPLPEGTKIPPLPPGVVYVASDTNEDKNGEEEYVLPVRAGQVVQVTKEIEATAKQGAWLFGNVLYDPTTEDGGGGGSGTSSGWFPNMLATTADAADMKKIA